MNKRYFLISTLFAVVLLTLTPSVSRQDSSYDPWADINLDGRVDVHDLAYLGMKYGTEGTPERIITPDMIADGALEKSATYIMRISGSTIEAINGTTGKIDYNGTDFSTVIQSAMDPLTNGGKIFIKAGTYLITARIFQTSPKLTVEGEGMFQTILKANNSLNDDMFSFTGSSYEHYINIANIGFDGNRANQDGNYHAVKLNRVTAKIGKAFFKNFGVAVYYDGGAWGSVEVESCYLQNGWSYGVHVVNARGIQIHDNKVFRTGALGGTIVYGSLLRATGTTQSNQFIDVSGNYVHEKANSGSEGNPIHFKGNIANAEVSHNIIRGRFFMGIHFISSAGGIYKPQNIVIEGNVIEGGDPSCNPIDVNGCKDVVISNNVVGGAKNSAENYGITFTGVEGRGIVIGNIIHDNEWTGFGATNAELLLIVNNILYNNAKDWAGNHFAIRVIATGSNTSNIRAFGNIMSDNQTTPTQTTGFMLKPRDATSVVNATLFENEIREGTTLFYGTGGGSGILNLITRNNIGYNPVGLISKPFGTSTVGLRGINVNPINTTVYTVSGVDCFITSSGGTDINITIYDPHDNIIATNIRELTMHWLPIGYKIKLVWATTPEVKVYGN